MRSGTRSSSNVIVAALRAASLLLAIATFATPGRLAAAEIEGVAFPAEVRAGDQSLPLHGLGLLRYRILFRGYVGGLYLPKSLPSDATLTDVPKALELSYFWDIEGRFFGEAADDLLARTHPSEHLARLRERLDRLHALYRDVRPGDRYRLTYVPGSGTTLSYNGLELGTIPGADFAEAYFGIWLGGDPLSETFRDQIFAGR